MDMKLKDNSFKVSIKKPSEQDIEDFSEEIGGAVFSPCAQHLHKKRHDVEQLDEEMKDIFIWWQWNFYLSRIGKDLMFRHELFSLKHNLIKVMRITGKNYNKYYNIWSRLLMICM